MDTSDNPSAPKPNETETLKPIGFMVQNPDIRAKLNEAIELTLLVVEMFTIRFREERLEKTRASLREKGIALHDCFNEERQTVRSDAVTNITFYISLREGVREAIQYSRKEVLEKNKAPINANIYLHNCVESLLDYHDPNSLFQTFGLYQVISVVLQCLPEVAKLFKDVVYKITKGAKRVIGFRNTLIGHPISGVRYAQHDNCISPRKGDGKLCYARSKNIRKVDRSKPYEKELLENTVKKHIPIVLEEVISLCQKIEKSHPDLALQARVEIERNKIKQ